MIGSNDVGYAAFSGLAFPPVDPDEFDADYWAMMMKLRADNPDAVIVSLNVFDLLGSPAFATPTEADALLSQGPFGQLGLPPTAELLGGLAADDLIPMSRYVRALLEGYPPEDLKDIVPVLTGEEQAVVGGVVALYNESIHQAAKSVGAVYVDIYDWGKETAIEGIEVTVNGQTLRLKTGEYDSGLYSTDGHFSKTGHAAAANLLIRKLNAKLKPTPRFELVDIDAVAATDLHVLKLLDE